jgi:hypothetical protein
MVVHCTTGQILRSTPAVPYQISGWRDHGIDLAGPVIDTFAEQLQTLGVLAGRVRMA